MTIAAIKGQSVADLKQANKKSKKEVKLLFKSEIKNKNT